MNIDRIIRVTSCFLFLTGYQIYWYDHKRLRYHLTVVGILYYLALTVFYIICFCHHFENSNLLQMLKYLSPFLSHLIRLQVVFGLTVFIIQIFESRNLRKVCNSSWQNFYEATMSVKGFVKFEMLFYLMLFATLLTTITIGLYIAIELQFELPPLDLIMVYMALFMPHFTLAGCLRLCTLSLFLTKLELVDLQTNFKTEDKNICPQSSIAVEILSPATNINCKDVIYKKVSKRLDALAEFFKSFDNVLQRQLGLLVGLNFNCLLAGAYCYVNYENTWKILFTARNQRIFYAAISGIFICILMDYGILLLSSLSFYRVKRKLYKLIEDQLFENNQPGLEMRAILKLILYKLSKKLKMKLFCLVKFNVWNFVMFQGLMISIIALIVSHQYLNDQIKVLNENFNAYDADSEK